jgi:hypothetical protein
LVSERAIFFCLLKPEKKYEALLISRARVSSVPSCFFGGGVRGEPGRRVLSSAKASKAKIRFQYNYLFCKITLSMLICETCAEIGYYVFVLRPPFYSYW